MNKRALLIGFNKSALKGFRLQKMTKFDFMRKLKFFNYFK